MKSWQLTTKTASQSGTMIKNQLRFSTDALSTADAIFTVKGPVQVVVYTPSNDSVYFIWCDSPVEGDEYFAHRSA